MDLFGGGAFLFQASLFLAAILGLSLLDSGKTLAKAAKGGKMAKCLRVGQLNWLHFESDPRPFFGFGFPENHHVAMTC